MWWLKLISFKIIIFNAIRELIRYAWNISQPAPTSRCISRYATKGRISMQRRVHYDCFRHYASGCGAFISQDPIGLAGGINLYQYAANPLAWVDPLGLSLLLPGERHVGPYGKLPGYPGDNLTGDHMASAEYIMKKFGISKNESIAMQMEKIYPEKRTSSAGQNIFQMTICP